MNLFLRSSLAASVAALALAGCDRNDDRPVGQKIDSAIDRTQQKLAEAGHKIQPKVEAAAEKTQQALTTAGFALLLLITFRAWFSIRLDA